MSFRNSPTYIERLNYSPNGSSVIKMPAGNLFAGITLDINLNVDIKTSACSNIPDNQIARVIKKLVIVMGSTTVWSVSGEVLQLLFAKSGGMEAPGNATISGAVADGKKGRLVLPLKFAPDDAMKPWDYLMDTRKANYEVRIEYRDLAAAGTLFGTIGTSIAVDNDKNYIDVQFDQLKLKPGPDGSLDALANQTPLMRGIIERPADILQSNVGMQFPLPDYYSFRNLWLWSTTEANANQTVGSGAVFDGKLEVKDSQQNTYLSVMAETQKQLTAMRWKNDAMNAGFYEIPFLKYGATGDAETSSGQVEMYLLASVAKQANATALRYIVDTAIQQRPT